MLKIANIRAKLLITIISLLTLVCGSLAGLCYYFSQQYLTKSVDDMAMAIGMNHANQIQAEIQGMTAQLEDLASIRSIQSGRDKQLILADLNQAYKRLGKFEGLFYFDLNGSGFRHDGTVVNILDRQHFKQIVSTQKPFISGLVVTRSSGKYRSLTMESL